MVSLTTLRLSTSELPIKIIKIYNIKGTDVVLEVEYLWNGWVKKDEVNATFVLCNWPNFIDTPIDFAFSPRLYHS